MPFAGGAVGYIGYDAAQWFEPALRDDQTQPLDPPTDAVWMFYRNVIAFDRVKQRLEIVSIVFTEEAGGSHARLRELYDQGERERLPTLITRLKFLEEKLNIPQDQRIPDAGS